tara:strand:+ start:468 stop:830 length:363 start_codon:yes stop_codon:yes gene_type:complete
MKKILLAEDEVMLLKTLEFKLKKDGYEIVAVQNGQEAIDKLSSEKFDLVVTDMMMPFKGGLDVIAAVKEAEGEIPVVVLSSVGQEEMVVKAFKLGAEDYITKPFSPNEFSMRIAKILKTE